MPRSMEGQGRVRASRPPPTLTSLAAIGLDFRRDAGKRARRRPGLADGYPRQGRDHDRACFGLPPGVHDRTSLTSDVLVVPHPRLRIDRLTDRAQQPQGGEIATLWPLIAPSHEGADRRWCGVEDGGAVAFDDLPEPILLWPDQERPRTSTPWRRWPAVRTPHSCAP